MVDVVSDVNSKIINSLTNFNLKGTIGTFVAVVAIILVIAAIGYILWIYPKKRAFKKKVTAFEIVGTNFMPVIRDIAKVVKLGTGGFEVLYLKKTKVYRLAYGGRVGKDTYYFFILPDGYWYNGLLSADMVQIDKNGGLIPVVATNPSVRSQYVALEKQIESLHLEKKGFMEKYGQWVFAISFVLISGVLLYLMFREFSTAMAGLANYNQQQTLILEKTANLLTNVQQLLSSTQGGTASNGLVPAG